MPDPTSPFAALSLLVAPAVLTNASSILVLSTSNRLARAVDRARVLSSELERVTGEPESKTASRRMNELVGSEERALLLLRALRCFYVAVGSFAAATLTSLLGAAMSPAGEGVFPRAFELVAVSAGAVGVGGLVLGCWLIGQETRIAVRVVSDRVAEVRERLGAPRSPFPG